MTRQAATRRGAFRAPRVRGRSRPCQAAGPGRCRSKGPRLARRVSDVDAAGSAAPDRSSTWKGDSMRKTILRLAALGLVALIPATAHAETKLTAKQKCDSTDQVVGWKAGPEGDSPLDSNHRASVFNAGTGVANGNWWCCSRRRRPTWAGMSPISQPELRLQRVG